MPLPQACSTTAAALGAAASLVLTASPVRADQTLTPQAPTQRVITIQDAIQMALTNDIDILISRQTPIIDQFTLRGDYSAYDPVFNVSATHNVTDIPAAINPTNGLTYSVRNASDTFAPSLGGILPIGTRYQLTGPLSYASGARIAPSTAYSGSAGFSLDQPLLKNLWIDQPRLVISLAKQTLRYDQLALRLQVMTVVNNVKAAYYNLIYDRQNVDVEREAVKLAQQLASENKKKVQLGSLAPLDETQAESQVASSKADLLTAQQTLAIQENSIKSLMALNLSEWAYVEPIPAEQLVALPENVNVLEAWRTALRLRPDIQQARVNLAKQRITLKYDFNQLFPELDLQGSYGQNGFGGSIGSDLNIIQQGHFKSYSYGAALTVPLDNLAARSTYKADKATLQQVLLQFKKVENAIITTIQNDV